jgi:Ca2+-binding RTX toxin-like protein
MAVINGTPSSDFIFGTDTEDQIKAFEGDDTVFGLAGNDAIQGNPGNDVLYGNAGNDTINGGFSNDLLWGGKGSDALFGDKGDDTLIGNRGADYLQGGEGRDFFVIGAGSGGSSFQEADIFSDFRNGEDIIGLTGGLAFRDLNIFQGTADNIGNTIIQNNFTGEYLAILQGVDRNTIGPGNFTAFEPVANVGLPTVSISATDASAGERIAQFVVGVDTGTFTVTRSNTVGNLTINYAISGTALNGSDYNNIATAVTIPDGQTSATILISPIEDGLTEPSETVVLGITPSAAYNVGIPSNATVTIVDFGGSSSGGGGGTPPGSGGGGNNSGATAGDDLLTGTTGADNIDGLAGNDTILGLAGNDTLTGGIGSDILTGGEGTDIFVYNLPTEGSDTITDFVIATETIRVSAAAFGGGLAAGALLAGQFELGTTATLAATRFIYNPATGELRFDVDGNTSGGVAPVLIATLTGAPAISETNIVVF